MLDLAEARAIAEERVAELSARLRTELAIDDAATREESWCWVFSYNSRAYLETGSFSDQLAGNGPIVVEKQSGARHELITARPIDEQLNELRDQHR